jgi:protein transport protein SEC23
MKNDIISNKNRLDRSLIRLINKFAEFKKDDSSSFRLSKEFTLFPQFMFHLRRSHFIQAFGSTPDESSFYKCTLLRENTTNSLVMIQPALLQYNFNNSYPQPVALDIESMKDDVILLLDTYF